ncbi:UDP-glucoronosyl/UDP-glucosyl transferase family protein [Tripterygium wilfordii]|uniref:Glycosyltransferase n=1 Tax=Tripterygium wilfordii TaxID=458696 RepID=A0A7J7C8D5_TRIWF|nr:UDP-glycosyltransferase 74B1-like [Tripterygium wilfordii]KAF5730097.1 UDP-glucoronosyl/UDP-glucosyl transferase family protein [Tripterygium wilfordii]
MQNYKGHVVVLTYPAQGHISPLLQFAKRLANKGLKATLATTYYTVKSFDATTVVGIEPISDGFDEGGFKQATNVQAYLESFRSVGSRTLAELVQKFNDSASPVNCIVYDSLLPWALDVARQFGIYGAVFLTTSASVCSFFWRIEHGSLALPPKQENMPLLLPGLPPLGFSDLPSFIAKPESQTAYLHVILEQFSRLNENDWVFSNSFEELESELVEAMLGLWPLMMVGPMVPSAYLDQQIHGDTGYGASFWTQNSDKCIKWLEKKQPKSVIYLSFGSMADIVAKQLEEIAWGLKASNKQFLWVTKESQNKLPIEFVNSLGEEGLLVEWCNQLEVLAHQAVGCFVTHCGWNSTLEGLSLGVPMVSIPQWSDQPTNAKFVEEWRVGVRAKKDGEGIVTREELKVCIEEIMVGENSEEIRRNANKYRELAKRAVGLGGSSDKNISQFVMKVIKDKEKGKSKGQQA